MPVENRNPSFSKSISIQFKSFSIRKHLYTDMERISGIWEIELQAVLEINKLGHRKRILYSVGSVPPNIGAQLTALGNSTTAEGSQRNASGTTATMNSDSSTGEQRRNHRKNRQAPKPPTNESILAKMNELKLEIRAPAELLLGFPTGLSTQWRHTAEALVSGAVKYEVNVSIPSTSRFSLTYLTRIYLVAVSGLDCGERATWNGINA